MFTFLKIVWSIIVLFRLNPAWSCIVKLNPAWSCIVKLDPAWSCIVKLDPAWSCIVKMFQSVNESLIRFKYYATAIVVFSRLSMNIF